MMKHHPDKSRLHRRPITIVTILLLVAGSTAWGVHELTAPAHGRPTKTGGALRPHPTLKPAVLPPDSVQNNYFRLALPAGYRQQANNQATPGVLYSQTLIKSAAFGSLIINIAVKSLSDGGLGEDSSYRLRLQQASRYHLGSQTIGTDQVQIADDSQAAAVVAFWPHGAYLATISVTSGISDPSTNGNTEQLVTLKTLLAAWQWQ